MTSVDAPSAGKREQTKAANRAAILRAGLEVFSDMGYGAASVRDIVRRTDLATGTFYNYFPDKEAVLRELLDEQAGEARLRIREARRASTTVEEFVRSGFKAWYEYLASDQLVFGMLHRNAGTIRAMFDEPSMGAGTDELLDDLRAGVASGVLPDMDVEMMARAMFGAGFEIAVLMLERDPTDVDHAVDFVTHLFLGGMQALRRS